MTETLNDILELRAHELRGPRGLNRTVSVSLAVHIGLIIVASLLARDWMSSPLSGTMMTVSLGVSPGPRATGMTPIGRQPVEAVADASRTARSIAAATPRAFDDLNVPSRNASQLPPATASPQAIAATPLVTGPEIRTGLSRVETGSQADGAGLTFGGGAGNATLTMGIAFCCEAYANDILSIISSRWQRAEGRRGETIVEFTILRDGRVTGKRVEVSSGNPLLDYQSRNAIPDQLIELPPEFKGSELRVHLRFPHGPGSAAAIL